MSSTRMAGGASPNWERRKSLILQTKSGSGGTRADQGGPPDRFGGPLTPETVVGPPDIVPLVGRLEPSGLGQVLLAGRFVEGDAQAGLVRDGDVALVDDRLVDAVHQVAPIGHVHGVILQHQEVLR